VADWCRVNDSCMIIFVTSFTIGAARHVCFQCYYSFIIFVIAFCLSYSLSKLIIISLGKFLVSYALYWLFTTRPRLAPQIRVRSLKGPWEKLVPALGSIPRVTCRSVEASVGSVYSEKTPGDGQKKCPKHVQFSLLHRACCRVTQLLYQLMHLYKIYTLKH